MEQAIISGVAHDRSEAKITVVGVPDKPGEAAAIFRAAGRRRDQHRHDRAERLGRRDRSHRHLVHAAQDRRADRDGGAGRGSRTRSASSDLLYDDQIGKVSLVGAGMRSHPGVSATFFGALADAGVNIEMISTSEIRISVVVPRADVDAAVRAVHTAFELDARGDRGGRLRRDRADEHAARPERRQSSARPGRSAP